MRAMARRFDAMVEAREATSFLAIAPGAHGRLVRALVPDMFFETAD